MPAKLERCVKKVRASLKERGVAGNPYAICRARLKEKLKNETKRWK